MSCNSATRLRKQNEIITHSRKRCPPSIEGSLRLDHALLRLGRATCVSALAISPARGNRQIREHSCLQKCISLRNFEASKKTNGGDYRGTPPKPRNPIMKSFACSLPKNILSLSRACL